MPEDLTDVSPQIGPVALLWTGGWDSTFRLLQLVLLRQRVVQPFYVFDEDRLSSARELAAMKEIRRALALKSTDASVLVLETNVIQKSAIPPDAHIRECWERLNRRDRLGTQYEWLARFVCQIGSAELSIHRERSRLGAYRHLENSVTRDGDGYRLLRTRSTSDLYSIFGSFRFPLWNYTKRDMHRIARKHSFEEILTMTWFCHLPDNFGRPCGECMPCLFVTDEGMGWRIPWSARVRRKVRSVRATLSSRPLLSRLKRAAASLRST